MEEDIHPQTLTKDKFIFYLKSNWFPEGEPEEFFSKLPKKLRRDKEVVKLSMYKLHCRCFIYADEELKRDKDLIIFGIIHEPEFFPLIPQELQKNEDLVCYIARHYGCYDFFPLDMQENPKVVLESAKNGSVINEIPPKIAKNKELIIETLNYSVIFYQNASEDLKNDLDIVHKAVLLDPYSFQSSSEKCKSDKDLCKEALIRNGNLLEFVSEELKNDRNLVKIAVKQSGESLKFAGQKFRGDKEIVMLSLIEYSTPIAYVSEDLLKDKEIAKLAIENDKFTENREFIALKYFLDFQNDRDFVKFAIQQNANSFIYASNKLKQDKEITKLAISFDGMLLKEATYFQDDLEIVTLAVSNNGLALQYASKKLKGNKELILNAVYQNGNALEFCIDFQDDFDVVLVAVQSNGESLKFASEKLRKTYKLIASAINENGSYLNEIPLQDKIYKKKEIIHTAIRKGCDISFLSQLNNNKDYYLTAAKKDGNMINLQENEEVFYDKDIMKFGLKTCPNLFFKLGQNLANEKSFIIDSVELNDSLSHLPMELLNDEEIIIKSLRNPSNFSWISEERRKDKKFILGILKKYKNPDILLNIHFDLLFDRDFIKYCLIIQGSCLAYFPFQYQDDKELVKIAIKNTSYSIQYASKKLQNDIELANITFEDDPTNLFFTNKENQYEILSKKCKISKDFYEKGDEILEIMKIEPEFYNLASFELQFNPNFFDECLKISPKFVNSLNLNKSTNKVNLIKIIENRATSIMLDLFPIRILKDRDIIMSFLKYNYEAFYFSDFLRYFKHDKELLEFALRILVSHHPLKDKETIREYFKSFTENNIFSRSQFDWYTTNMLNSRDFWIILKRLYKIPYHQSLSNSMIHFNFE